jgi:hypothetical protein
MPQILLDSAALAAKLKRSLSRFRSIRPTLETDEGMPLPLNVAGHPVWLESEIVAWLLSRSRNQAGGVGAK